MDLCNLPSVDDDNSNEYDDDDDDDDNDDGVVDGNGEGYESDGYMMVICTDFGMPQE